MKKIKPVDIYNYYLSDDCDLRLPDNPGFRHFRFKLPDKGWRKVPLNVNNVDALKKWIIKLGGCDIYYSTTQWLNPESISAKNLSGTYACANNTLINNDLVFDIDADEPITMESLNKARKSAHNIYQTMKEFSGEFKLDYAAFTGLKGFRLAYKDLNLDLPESFRHRLDYVTNKRKLFIDQLLKKLQENANKQGYYSIKAFFDQKITTNVMCVVRVIGSVHSTTGYISTKIPASSLKKPVKDILNHIPYIGKVRPAIPLREMRKGDKESTPRPRLLQSAKDVSGLASLPSIDKEYKFFITNKVLGVRKGFVPFFIYQETNKNYISELKHLQSKFKLGPISVFKSGHNYIAIALKTMQRRQLQKVLNKSTSRTKYDFMKYKRIFAPYAMDFHRILRFKFTGHLSKGHFKYVCPEGKLTDGCGWDKIEMIFAHNKEGKNGN